MYKSVSEIEKKIDDYFEWCAGRPMLDADGYAITDRSGKVVMTPQRPLTVTGLALALGFSSRQSLLNYQGKAEFVDTIMRAKARIEQYAEERLYDKDGANGAKFSLANNFEGWRDKREIEADVKQAVTINIELLDDDDE